MVLNAFNLTNLRDPSYNFVYPSHFILFVVEFRTFFFLLNNINLIFLKKQIIFFIKKKSKFALFKKIFFFFFIEFHFQGFLIQLLFKLKIKKMNP